MMRIRSKTLLRVAALAALTALAAPAVAEEDGANEGHDMSTMMSAEDGGNEGHDMSAMMSAGDGGSWSYAGRDNPMMRMQDRWEMVPVAGRAGAAVSASAMTPEERCAALMAAEDLMRDHATRAACMGTSTSAQSTTTEIQQKPSQNQGMDHGKMNDGD